MVLLARRLPTVRIRGREGRITQVCRLQKSLPNSSIACFHTIAFLRSYSISTGGVLATTGRSCNHHILMNRSQVQSKLGVTIPTCKSVYSWAVMHESLILWLSKATAFCYTLLVASRIRGQVRSLGVSWTSLLCCPSWAQTPAEFRDSSSPTTHHNDFHIYQAFGSTIGRDASGPRAECRWLQP